jgi:hypothetical protein
LKAFGGFKIVAELIHTVKGAVVLVLLVKKETVRQGINDKRIEIGRGWGMEMNVLK